jgi:predicted dehydrogenase
VRAVEPVRWGILGAAGIAASAFLPALDEAGDGRAIVVGSRDVDRATAWAEANGVASAVGSYEAVLADADVEAVYIPLPNALHAEWTIAALEAGKAVFCEKPLAATPAETARVLEAARDGLLWEAFVFPFSAQTERLTALLGDGAVGDVREVVSRFHFDLDDPGDIRMSAELAGGATQDVGCYAIRLARLVFDAEPLTDRAVADAVWQGGVDAELWGALAFPGDRRLVFSCGFRSAYDTTTSVNGTRGTIRLTDPFHPEGADTVTLIRDGDVIETWPAAPAGERSFTAAIRHIHRAIRDDERPRHLAVHEAMGNADAIDALLAAAHGR